MSRRALLLGLVALAQIAAVAYTLWDATRAQRQGRIWRFQTGPIDPVDVLRGRYVQLGFRETGGPMAPGADLAAGRFAFAALEEGPDGFARIARVSDAPPDGPDYLRARVRALEPGRVAIDFPVDRFYLPEAKAQAADRLLLQADATIWAEIRVWHGRAAVLDVLVDGTPLRAAVSETE